MANTIDERVVSMKFDNSGFQAGVDQTNKSLDSLKKGLDLSSAAKGIDQVGAAANGLNLSSIASGVDALKSKFSTLGIAGVTAISDITTSVLNFAKNQVTDVLAPIIQGGSQRAHAIEQAKFQFQGLGLNINQTMAASLAAVKGTAFGLDEAATAAAQFGASGITATNGLTPVLKSIAGVAAQTGSQFGDIATIFEGVAGNGRLMGNDLLQLSSRGVNAAAILGKSLGKSEADVRTMVTKGQISFQEFSDAMNKAFGANASKASETYSGALDNMHAALSRLGADYETPKFEAQRKVFNALTPAIDAFHAALLPAITDYGRLENIGSDKLVKSIGALSFTKVKQDAAAFVNLMDNLYSLVVQIAAPIKAAFSDIFPASTTNTLAKVIQFFADLVDKLTPIPATADKIRLTFGGIFAIFDIAGQIISGLVGVVVKLFSSFSGGGTSILDVTAKIGGFLEKLDEAIKSGNGLTTFFTILGNILVEPIKLIKDFGGALNNAFSGSGYDLLGKSIDNVKQRLTPLATLARDVDTAWQAVLNVLVKLSGVFGPISKAFGDFFKSLGTAIVNGIKTENFSGVLELFNAGLLGSLVLLVTKFVAILNDGHLKLNIGIFSSVRASFSALTGTLQTMQNKLKVEVLQKIALTIALLTASVIALSFVSPSKLTASLTAITVMMGQLFGMMAVFEKTSGSKGVLDIFKVSSALIAFATAIDILTIAVVALGKQDVGTLAKGLAAIATILGIVGVASAKFPKESELAGSAAGMILLGIALNVLAKAIKTLGSMDLGSLAKGLGGVGVALAELAGFNKILKTDNLDPKTAVSLVVLAGAIYILGQAVSVFGKLPVGDLAKGVGALAVTLGLIVAFGKTTSDGAGLVKTGIAMVIVGGAIAVLANAVKSLGSLDIATLGKGLGALVVILAAIVGAFNLMPNTVILLGDSLAFIAVAGAIMIISNSLKILGGMSVGEIVKSLIALAGGLLIIAVALIGMTEALPGAAALIVAAAAIAVLTPSLVVLGNMSLGDIGKGLLALAGAFVILGAGGAALGVVSPLIAAAGLALILLGGGIALIGGGVAAFAVGVTLLAAAGATGASALTVFVTAILGLLPLAAEQLGLAIVAFAKVIGDAAPTMVTAMAKLIVSLADGIAKAGPAIINTLVVLLNSLLNAVDKNLPNWLKMGGTIMVNFLNGVAKYIGPIITAGNNLMVQFLNGVAKNEGRVIAAGTNIIVQFIKGIGSSALTIVNAADNTIIKFVNGLASSITNHQKAMNAAGANLAGAIVSGMTGGLLSAKSITGVISAAQNLASKIPSAIQKLLQINSPSKLIRGIIGSVGEGAVLGLQDGEGDVGNAAVSLGTKAITGVKKALASISDAVNMNITAQPTIRPVLDLDQVKKDASTINGLLPNPTLSVTGTLNTASTAIAGADANVATIKAASLTVSSDTAKAVAPNVNLTQNNYSPVALTPIEIYRQTNNQLNAVKGTLVSV